MLLGVAAAIAGCANGRSMMEGRDGGPPSTMDAALDSGSTEFPDAFFSTPDALGLDAPGLDAPRPSTPCDPLSVTPSTVDGYVSDVVRWLDADCEPRTAALVRNDARDPSGHYGGLVRRFTYELAGATRTCDGSFDGHPGFGEVVNHFADTATLSTNYAGTYDTLLSGPHHAIHEYRWRYAIDGEDVSVIVHWFFATGRDHPIYAITFDLTGVADGAVQADSRAPYGDVRWDGEPGGTPVSGVGWGDRRRFESLDSPISLASGWTYEEENRIPYSMMWTVAPDAEMGLVQTETWQTHDAGGYWFYSAWGTRDDDGPMPMDWNWAYQLNQYELPFSGGNTSKRLAWGLNFGAVGDSAYSVHGDDGTASGWPFQSYSVFVVLGAHSSSSVDAQATSVESLVDARITATVGSVVTSGPGGVGRTDSVPRAIAGYDPRYAVFDTRAASNALTVTLTPVTPVHWPILVIHDWTAGDPASVTVGGIETPALSTVDTDTLWLTIATDVTTATEIAVR